MSIHAPLLDAVGVPHVFLTRDETHLEDPFPLEQRTAACRADRAYDPIAINYASVRTAFPAGSRIFFSNQQHTAIVQHITENTPENLGAIPVCDALITTQHQTVLAIYTADCVPILLIDLKAGVCAAVHGGWRGLAANIIAKTVNCMKKCGARPGRIHAAIGPCIHPPHYTVGVDFPKNFPHLERFFAPIASSSGDVSRVSADLPGIATAQLQEIGVEAIVPSPANTYTRSDFYSYRRSQEAGVALPGVQASAIALP